MIKGRRAVKRVRGGWFRCQVAFCCQVFLPAAAPASEMKRPAESGSISTQLQPVSRGVLPANHTHTQEEVISLPAAFQSYRAF